MMTKQFTRDNHYVPESYLRHWAGEDGKLFASRLLVPHEGMHLWRPVSPPGIAKHQNLYTRLVAGEESDDIEHWLNRDFETPAQSSILKATSGDRLSDEDWRHIVRFAAAQDVRTPAKLHKTIKYWSENLPKLLDETLQESVAALQEAHKSGVSLKTEEVPFADHFPIRVEKTFEPGAEEGTIRVETLAGRGFWLFSLRRQLANTLNALHRHKWTILLCPQDMTWMTSDDPVVKLNYNSPTNYNFGGGWGSRGTQIFMPLGPRHLLFTQIGVRAPTRGTVLPVQAANAYQKFIVEHAHRFVFASAPNSKLPEIRPRHVDLEAFQSEAEQWANWHESQVVAENSLMNS